MDVGTILDSTAAATPQPPLRNGAPPPPHLPPPSLLPPSLHPPSLPPHHDYDARYVHAHSHTSYAPPAYHALPARDPAACATPAPPVAPVAPVARMSGATPVVPHHGLPNTRYVTPYGTMPYARHQHDRYPTLQQQHDYDQRQHPQHFHNVLAPRAQASPSPHQYYVSQHAAAVASAKPWPAPASWPAVASWPAPKSWPAHAGLNRAHHAEYFHSPHAAHTRGPRATIRHHTDAIQCNRPPDTRAAARHGRVEPRAPTLPDDTPPDPNPSGMRPLEQCAQGDDVFYAPAFPRSYSTQLALPHTQIAPPNTYPASSAPCSMTGLRNAAACDPDPAMSCVPPPNVQQDPTPSRTSARDPPPLPNSPSRPSKPASVQSSYDRPPHADLPGTSRDPVNVATASQPTMQPMTVLETIRNTRFTGPLYQVGSYPATEEAIPDSQPPNDAQNGQRVPVLAALRAWQSADAATGNRPRQAWTQKKPKMQAGQKKRTPKPKSTPLPPPPDPDERFPTVVSEFHGIPPLAVADLLHVWHFMSTFYRALRIPWCSLATFERAVAANEPRTWLSRLVIRLVYTILSDDNLVSEFGLRKATVNELKAIKPSRRCGAVPEVLGALPALLSPEAVEDEPADRGLSRAFAQMRDSSDRLPFYTVITAAERVRILRELVDYACMSDALRECVQNSIEHAVEERKRAREEIAANRKKYESQLKDLREELDEYRRNHDMDLGEPTEGGVQTDEPAAESDDAKLTRKEKLSAARREREAERAKRDVQRGAQALELKIEKMRASLKALRSVRLRQTRTDSTRREEAGRTDGTTREPPPVSCAGVIDSESDPVRSYHLGTDRHGRVYWVFDGVGRLLIEDPAAGTWCYMAEKGELAQLLRWLSPSRPSEVAIAADLQKRMTKLEAAIVREARADATWADDQDAEGETVAAGDTELGDSDGFGELDSSSKLKEEPSATVRRSARVLTRQAAVVETPVRETPTDRTTPRGGAVTRRRSRLADTDTDVTAEPARTGPRRSSRVPTPTRKRRVDGSSGTGAGNDDGAAVPPPRRRARSGTS